MGTRLATQDAARFGEGQALALAQLVEFVGVFFGQFRVGRVDDRYVHLDIEFGHLLLDFLFIADQDRFGNAVFHQRLGGPQDLLVVAFGEDDAFGIALGLVDDHAHDLFGLALGRFQVLDVLGHVFDRLAGHAALHGGPGNGRGNMQQDARVERFGNDVVAAEGELDVAVGLADRVGYLFAGQLGQGLDRGQFHLFVDTGGTTVQGPTEDEGKAQHVVDLVGIVGTAGGDHDVTAD